jgi:hypothetical protein
MTCFLCLFFEFLQLLTPGAGRVTQWFKSGAYNLPKNNQPSVQNLRRMTGPERHLLAELSVVAAAGW